MILTDRNTIPFEFFLRFSKLCHEERRWVYLSGMKKERLQDSMVSIISWIVEITGRGVGEGRLLLFFFLIRRENSFHVLLPFFVAVYRCSLQSHDHEFNRARWLAQSSFPGCLPEERLFNNWNTRKKQLLPKLHRATVPFHRSRAVEDFRDEIHRVIKTETPPCSVIYFISSIVSLLLVTFWSKSKVVVARNLARPWKEANDTVIYTDA